MDRLVLRGSTIVPVLNMAEQLNDPKWKRWPKKLNELHIPIPYVIGPFSDATKSDDPDGRAFAKEVAAVMWMAAEQSEVPKTTEPSSMGHVTGPFSDATKSDNPDGRAFAKEGAAMTWMATEKSEIAKTQEGSSMDRVLPCALTMGFSAKYLLDALSSESTQGRPSLHTAWAKKSDPTFWVGLLFGSRCVVVSFLLVFGQCLRYLFELKNEAEYNATSTERLDRSYRFILSDSKLDAVIGAIAQVASESPEEKGAKQLKYLKVKLFDIGQELECVQAYPVCPIIKNFC